MNDFSQVWKFAIVGEANSGKTSLLIRYTENSFSDKESPTLVIDSKKRSINLNDKQVTLQLFDTQGQERFRSMTAGFFRGAQAVVIVYDIAKRQSFEKLPEWIGNIRISTFKNCVVALCGNKVDLEKAREVTKEEGKSRADQENFLFFEVSAKNGTGVEEMFLQLAESINNSINMNLGINTSSTIKKKSNCVIL